MSIKNLKLQLYAISSTQGFCIWYAIDKLFFLEHGVTTQQVIIIGILAWVPQILFEIPSSVLADRWSRKGVLMLSGAGMFISTLVLGAGSSFLVFAVGYTIWAFGAAMMSGTYEALVYDMLKDRGETKQYKTLQGQLRSVFLAAMVLSGFAALGVAHSLDLRYAFFLCLPVIVCNLFLVYNIKEPPESSSTHRSLTWFYHLADAAAIMKSVALRWLAFLFIALIGLRSVLYEYYQLVGTDKGMHTEAVTVLFVTIVSAMAGVAYLFSKIKLSRMAVNTVWVLFVLSSTLGLAFDNAIVATVNLLVLLGCIEFIQLYLQVEVQDLIDSSKRATILSSLTALGQVLFLGLAVIMMFTVKTYGISLAITISAVPLLLLAFRELHKLGPILRHETQ